MKLLIISIGFFITSILNAQNFPLWDRTTDDFSSAYGSREITSTAYIVSVMVHTLTQ